MINILCQLSLDQYTSDWQETVIKHVTNGNVSSQDCQTTDNKINIGQFSS